MDQNYSQNNIKNGAFGVQIGMPSGNPGRAMNSCRTSVASNLMAFVLQKMKWTRFSALSSLFEYGAPLVKGVVGKISQMFSIFGAKKKL
jgi:hypothetical protein